MHSLSNSFAVVEVRGAKDIVLSRQRARELAARLGFGPADQTRLATAVTKLTRNVVGYAGSGQCRIDDVSDTLFFCIRVIVEDQGPGILDIDLAMQDGFSTGGSLGAGLPGSRRLVDSFKIESRPGSTRITIMLSKRKI